MRVAVAVAVSLLAVVITSGWTAATNSVSPRIVFVSSPVHTGWRVPSSSMEPTLHCARPGAGCLGRYPDWPLVEPILGPVQRQDIVVFRTPELAAIRCGAGGIFIKRIIALPGDTWSEKNGYVYINGKKLNEPYVNAGNRDFRTIPSITIPPGHYFVMGDNRAASCDSRAWGTVPRADIIGQVTKVYRER